MGKTCQPFHIGIILFSLKSMMFYNPGALLTCIVRPLFKRKEIFAAGEGIAGNRATILLKKPNRSNRFRPLFPARSRN